MIIVGTREIWPGEKRVAIVPQTVQKLTQLGCTVRIERGAGLAAAALDNEYTDAGAEIFTDPVSALPDADVIVSVRSPSEERIRLYREGSTHISFLDPFRQPKIVEALRVQGVLSVSLEMIPRSTIAQKMDALSSQASLAGYAAMIIAAQHLPRIFPMMMTPAGTLSPARVFVIGAGVAGLQAIATAHRLGARIDAFDTRPVVKEEVQSLGANFIEIDLGDTGQTEQGYAQALSEEQLARQRDAMAAVIARSDVVVTTAQVFGREAPVIVTTDMVEAMKPTSVVVDLASESGGNVECSVHGEVVQVNDVAVIGPDNPPSFVAAHASQMYASNIYEFINHFWNNDAKSLDLQSESDILERCVLTRDKQIVNTSLEMS